MENIRIITAQVVDPYDLIKKGIRIKARIQPSRKTGSDHILKTASESNLISKNLFQIRPMHSDLTGSGSATLLFTNENS